MSGCALSPPVSGTPAEERFTGFPPPAEEAEAVEDPALVAAREQADQLATEIARGAGGAARSGPPVRWIDARHPDEREPAPTTAVRPLSLATVVAAEPEPKPVEAAPPPKSAEPAPEVQVTTTARPIDRKAIARVLMHQIRQSDDPALTKAMNAAALSVVSGDRKISDAILASLDPQQRLTVQRYHTLLLKVTDQVAAGDAQVDPKRFAEEMQGVFGDQPITIRTVELCRRVDNFGVFEPFTSTSFLAGRAQKMIVYVELDYFQSVKGDDDQHEVRLSQEVTLYNEADGLPVWRAPKETIVDHSRNRRRDFFTVKMIRLPANLGVGKYQLKVTVEDLNGQSVAASNVAVHVVADAALASKPIK